MISLFLLKAAITVVTLLLLLLACWLTLRLADKLLGIKFEALFEQLKGEPIALAIYLGLRLVAVFIACAVVLCLAFLF